MKMGAVVAFVLVGLALLFLLSDLHSPYLRSLPTIAIGALLLRRLIPGLPRRWFRPPITRAETKGESGSCSPPRWSS